MFLNKPGLVDALLKSPGIQLNVPGARLAPMFLAAFAHPRNVIVDPNTQAVMPDHTIFWKLFEYAKSRGLRIDYKALLAPLGDYPYGQELLVELELNALELSGEIFPQPSGFRVGAESLAPSIKPFILSSVKRKAKEFDEEDSSYFAKDTNNHVLRPKMS